MGNIRLYLRANEKLYINGAVIRFDRKTSIELLNDVSFLLENHVMQVEDAKSPMRQLYFVVQMMLMDPANIDAPMKLFESMLVSLRSSLKDDDMLEALDGIESDVRNGESFRALKSIRQQFEPEDRLITRSRDNARDLPLPTAELALQNGA
jgi:flagellar protein FlbT